MISMEDVYQKIVFSDELKSRFSAIRDKEGLKRFLEELGFQEPPEKFIEYVKGRFEGEIPDEEVASVAGGVQASDVFQRVYHDYVRPVIDQVYYF